MIMKKHFLVSVIESITMKKLFKLFCSVSITSALCIMTTSLISILTGNYSFLIYGLIIGYFGIVSMVIMGIVYYHNENNKNEKK